MTTAQQIIDEAATLATTDYQRALIRGEARFFGDNPKGHDAIYAERGAADDCLQTVARRHGANVQSYYGEVFVILANNGGMLGLRGLTHELARKEHARLHGYDPDTY